MHFAKSLLVALTLLLAGSFPRIQSDEGTGSLLGTWESPDRETLWCRLEFQEKGKGKLLTFRQQKHLSTLNFWWRQTPTARKVKLGVNGEVELLDDGQLQLHLRPVNTNIVTLREATLKRVNKSVEAK